MSGNIREATAWRGDGTLGREFQSELGEIVVVLEEKGRFEFVCPVADAFSRFGGHSRHEVRVSITLFRSLPRPLDFGVQVSVVEVVVVPEDAERMLGKQLGGSRAFLGIAGEWHRSVSKRKSFPTENKGDQWPRVR